MKQIEGIWIPDGDEHFTKMLTLPGNPHHRGAATYQLKKLHTVLRYIPTERRAHAVDVGAHVGLWSRVLQDSFQFVSSFEPLAVHRECFAKNVNPGNVKLYPFALGSEHGTVRIHMPPDNTGHAHVHPDGELCEVRILDEMFLNPNYPLDFLKIDVEGFELQVVKGAVETIRRMRPVIIIEQKPDNAELQGAGRYDAVDLLSDLGYTQREVISGDHIMTWGD